MDYGFTDSEILFLYMHLKQQLKKLEEIKSMGQSGLVKDDIKLFSSVIKKIETKHPGYLSLPM